MMGITVYLRFITSLDFSVTFFATKLASFKKPINKGTTDM